MFSKINLIYTYCCIISPYHVVIIAFTLDSHRVVIQHVNDTCTFIVIKRARSK